MYKLLCLGPPDSYFLAAQILLRFLASAQLNHDDWLIAQLSQQVSVIKHTFERLSSSYRIARNFYKLLETAMTEGSSVIPQSFAMVVSPLPAHLPVPSLSLIAKLTCPPSPTVRPRVLHPQVVSSPLDFISILLASPKNLSYLAPVLPSQPTFSLPSCLIYTTPTPSCLTSPDPFSRENLVFFFMCYVTNLFPPIMPTFSLLPSCGSFSQGQKGFSSERESGNLM